MQVIFDVGEIPRVAEEPRLIESTRTLTTPCVGAP